MVETNPVGKLADGPGGGAIRIATARTSGATGTEEPARAPHRPVQI